MERQKISLHTGALQFAGAEIDRKRRCVVFAWMAETESPNHKYVKAIGFGLAWPPVRWISSFLQTDGELQ